MNNDLLEWFEENYPHVISHYLNSVANITRRQRKADLTLDARFQPSKTVLDLYNALPAKESVEMMKDLAGNEDEIERRENEAKAETDSLKRYIKDELGKCTTAIFETMTEIHRLAMLPADGSEPKDGESTNPMDILFRIAELTK